MSFFEYVTIRIALVLVVVMTVLLLFSDNVKADDYANAMIGVANSGKSSPSESKLLAFGHRDPLALGLSYQYEFGGWADRAGNGRKSSGYGAFQVGVEAGDYTVARVMFGPTLITTPDAYLGGHFNFAEDFFFGIRGKSGNTVGIIYKHVSNAGLTEPNMGRDFGGVQVSVPF